MLTVEEQYEEARKLIWEAGRAGKGPNRRELLAQAFKILDELRERLVQQDGG